MNQPGQPMPPSSPARPGKPKRILSSLLALALALAAFTGSLIPESVYGERAPAMAAGARIEDAGEEARVIVKYRPGAVIAQTPSTIGSLRRQPMHARAMGQRLRLPLTDGRVLGPHTQSLRGSGLSSDQLAARLSTMADVEWAFPDKRRTIAALPNDPLLSDGQTTTTPVAGQWYLRPPDSTFIAAVNATGAWDITEGSPAMTVAILDTGVLPDHPDLAGKLHPGYDFVQNAVTARDGSGRDADPTDPGDHTTAGECGTGRAAQNSSWHGTKVAGLIGAATDNGLGIAGVGHRVMVLPVRVLGLCGGFDSDIIAAMRWSAGLTAEVGVGESVTRVNDHPARVINMSLGSRDTCQAPYQEVIAELNAASVSVVVAAGNQNGLAVNTPANCPGAIGVAGLRHIGTKVGYSSLGPEVSIAAPAGNCVNETGTCLYPLVTTTNAGTSVATTDYTYSTNTNPTLGTSFSAPLVAGTAALMLSINPALSPAQLKAALQSTARPFPTTGAAPDVNSCRAATNADQLECYCTTATCGAGMLNTSQAVAKAQEPAVNITGSAPETAVGVAAILDGSSSVASLGRTIAAYAWSVASGAQYARFTGSTSGSTATLTGVAEGAVEIQLVVTDNLGATSSSTLTLQITPAPKGGSGGGAWGLDGLLLALATGAAWWLRRRGRAAGACTF